jgi:DNA (cytosine-5)-methyltransferase 1
LIELSLFTGAGGGVLGTKLLGWRTVGYVEFDDYCQKVLAQRIQDGFLDEAPIFGDIDDFIESGAAKKYKGYVDVVTAGFPCQPFSVAGKKKGQDDSRNKWPQTLAVLCDVRPQYALLENVPGLLTVNGGGYFAQILSDLAESGFDARWDCISAAACGAPHRRNRLWILAKSQHPDTYSIGSHRTQEYQYGSAESEYEQVSQSGPVREILADSDSITSEKPGIDQTNEKKSGGWRNNSRRSGSNDRRVINTSKNADVADSEGERYRGRDREERRDEGWNLQQSEQAGSPVGREVEGRCGSRREDVADTDEKRPQGVRPDDGQKRWEIEGGSPGLRDGAEPGRKSNWWSTEPDVGRVVDELAFELDFPGAVAK